MGRNRRTMQRQRDIQRAKAITLGRAVSAPESAKVITIYPEEATNMSINDDTTLVAATAYAEATVTKAVDLIGVPFSVQMLDVIRASGLQGVTLDDLHNRFPDVKKSSVTARLSEAKKKGTVMQVGERIGTSGRMMPVLVAVTP